MRYIELYECELAEILETLYEFRRNIIRIPEEKTEHDVDSSEHVHDNSDYTDNRYNYN